MAKVALFAFVVFLIVSVNSQYFYPMLDNFAPLHHVGHSKPLNAIAYMEGQHTNGVLYFHQSSPISPVIITGEIHGLEKGEHGMHVHEFGDLTHGCESAGEHYNPYHKNHGGQFDDDRHLGDLGNIVAGGHGVAKVYKVDQVMSLFGEHSVLGRTMVVHANPDDLGQGGDEESKKSGNSGDRLACGIIHVIKH
ncbi:superoxide dismutase [Cu-Zn]-like [Centruroides vittatus]|uniref:superoxide dismutase [Cu-Zn]-like n=1 Tax=Centruroides vittatus TaxID=120091 RepID=UPI00350F7BFE